MFLELRASRVLRALQISLRVAFYAKTRIMMLHSEFCVVWLRYWQKELASLIFISNGYRNLKHFVALFIQNIRMALERILIDFG